MDSGTVFDIGGSVLSTSLKSMIFGKMMQRFSPDEDNKQLYQYVLPSALLSDEKGLDLWRKINRLPNYYQTSEEISLLELNRWSIIQHIVEGTAIIDLGMGDIRKIRPLLDALEQSKVRVDYYALDLSYETLKTEIHAAAGAYSYVRCYGLWGTFDDGRQWLQSSSSPPSSPSSPTSVAAPQMASTLPNIPAPHGPKLLLSLGSILGNDWLSPAISHLKAWSELMQPQDRMLLCMDATSNIHKVWASYHDKDGLFVSFIRNGMKHSNLVLGTEWYKEEDWEIEGILNEEPLMHRFVIRALNDVLDAKSGLSFSKGDSIDCYEAFKYAPSIMRRQFAMANLAELGEWSLPGSQIYEYLLAPGRDPS